MQSEELRTLALAAGQMGTWTWDAVSGLLTWDEGQYRIFGVDPDDFAVTIGNVRALVHPEDWDHLREAWWQVNEHTQYLQTEFRVLRPSGELRWCIGTAAAGVVSSEVVRVSGVTVDITTKEAEERQACWRARSITARATCSPWCSRSLV